MFSWLKPLFFQGNQAIITNGRQRAQLGIWCSWKGKQKPNPAIRLEITFHFFGTEKKCSAIYALVPAQQAPYLQSIELTQEFRELLVGEHRATEGRFDFEFLFLDGSKQRQSLPLREVYYCYRGMGRTPIVSLPKIDRVGHPATEAQAALDLNGLIQLGNEILANEEAARIEAQKKAEEKAKLEAERKAALEGGGEGADKPKTERLTAEKMKETKIGIIYGSSTGNTADVANQIKEALGESDLMMKAITEISPSVFEKFQHILLGVPTWHIGEMQDDWAEFLKEMKRKKPNLKGKKVAIFGLGDGVGYADTYVDAMQELWDEFKPCGVELVGFWPAEGYIFEKSKALKDGKFCGLVIDIENQNDQTPERVSKWVTQIKGELGL